MAAPTIKKSKIEQVIDFGEEFGKDLSEDKSLRLAIGQAIIDRIIDRTANGESMDFDSSGRGRLGKLKAPYSQSYADSDEFKAAGKSKNKVNMELRGEMLDSIDIKKAEGNSVTIGITEHEQKLKAFNHCTGDTLPKRPFFGVSKAELKEIKRSFASDLRSVKGPEPERLPFEAAVLKLLKELNGAG